MRLALLLLIAIAAVLAGGGGGARAHDQGPAVARAVEGLNAGPVTYEPESGLTELEADALGRRLTSTPGIYVALLAPSSLQSSVTATAADLGRHVGRSGTYVVSAGRQLGAWSSDLPDARLRELLATARTTEPRAIALQELAAAIAAEPGPDGGGHWKLVGAMAGATALTLAALLGLRRRAASSRS